MPYGIIKLIKENFSGTHLPVYDWQFNLYAFYASLCGEVSSLMAETFDISLLCSHC